MRVVPFLFILTTGLFTPGMMLKAYAQVTSDGTTNTIVNSNGNNFNIINGLEKGNNLFHSFSNFSVPTGGSATFNLVNTPNITTIFSRVTGGNISNIDGLIRTLNSSNPVSLFLMNPNGIVFGQNASLNIGGSFVGTTANSIKFSDGSEFSAVNPTAKPLLTMSVPIGLQMGQNPGAIANRATSSTKFSVKSGQTFGLAGGTITSEGGRMAAPSGRIELAALGANETLSIDTNNNRLSFTIADTVPRGDIFLSNGALLDVSAPRGGSIAIAAQNLQLQNSEIRAGVSGKGSTAVTSGNIDINLLDTLRMADSSVITTRINSNSVGNAGNINVSTGSLFATGGSQFSGSARGIGNAGDININARDIVSFDGVSSIGSGILSVLRPEGIGKGGNIHVVARTFSVTNGGRIITATEGQGDAGNITIQARDAVVFDGFRAPVGPSAAVSEVRVNGNRIPKGNAGNVSITADSISVKNGAQLSGRTSGDGNGGNIILNANTVNVLNAANVFTTSFTAGNAGNITVNARDSINLEGNNPELQSQLRNISFSLVQTAGSASGFYANTEQGSSGKGGTLNISTGRLAIQDGAIINVGSQGTGDAGNINIAAKEIFLSDAGRLNADVNSGSQGNIHLESDILLMRNSSQISTNAGTTANGGNIQIAANSIIQFGNSDITANATKGQGGNINITTQALLGGKFRTQLTPENDITASSEFGVNGTVDINNFGVDPNSGLVELPVNLVDSSKLIATGCSANQGSSFVATGRGGVPQNPLQQVWSDRTWSDTRDISAYRKTGNVTAQILTSAQTLVPATSWHRNPDGKVELIADKSSVQLQPTLACTGISR
jgi:filamentous hemagglutinin family protein